MYTPPRFLPISHYNRDTELQSARTRVYAPACAPARERSERNSMKLKKIERICKQTRCVFIYDDMMTVGDETGLVCQWIGDGHAAYAIDGAPYLDENGVCAIFDIGERNRPKITVVHKEELPSGLCFSDVWEGEEPLEPVELKMTLNGIPLYLLRDSSGSMIVIKDIYRMPFDNWLACACYKRISKEGEAYIAVKTGFVLRGVILPYDCISDSFVDALHAAHKAAGVSVAKRRQEEQLRI